eukprot:2576269-Prymnesium_polylepis.1
MYHIQESKLSLRAIAFLIDGYGTLLHHLSTSFTLVGLMMHLFPRDRALTAACVVPIMQHMFILVKYHAHTTYLIIELVLEGWFQWEVLSNISAFHSHYGLDITRIGRGMAMTMLVAHWLYLTGSVLHMLDDQLNKNEMGEQSLKDGRRSCVSESRAIAKQGTMQMFLAASNAVDTGRKPGIAGMAQRGRVGLQRAMSSANNAVTVV